MRRARMSIGSVRCARDNGMLGEEANVKAYWITAGVGTLVAVVGGVIYFTTDERYGLIIILSGLVIAVLGVVMRIAMAFIGDKVK